MQSVSHLVRGRYRAETSTRGSASSIAVLATVLAGFSLVLVFLVWSSLTPRTAVVFEPTPAGLDLKSSGEGPIDTVTIDARHETQWQSFDFQTGAITTLANAPRWDLAVRRFSVMPAIAAADLGEVGFDAPVQVSGLAFTNTTFGRDTVNQALDRWYRYSMVSHLLEPNGHVYVVQTRDGEYVKLEFLSYYCPGVEAGCVTLRWITVRGAR